MPRFVDELLQTSPAGQRTGAPEERPEPDNSAENPGLADGADSSMVSPRAGKGMDILNGYFRYNLYIHMLYV